MINFTIVGWELPYSDKDVRKGIAVSYNLPGVDITNDDSIWNALCIFAADDKSPLFICEQTKQMYYGLISACWDQFVIQAFVRRPR